MNIKVRVGNRTKLNNCWDPEVRLWCEADYAYPSANEWIIWHSGFLLDKEQFEESWHHDEYTLSSIYKETGRVTYDLSFTQQSVTVNGELFTRSRDGFPRCLSIVAVEKDYVVVVFDDNEMYKIVVKNDE